MCAAFRDFTPQKAMIYDEFLKDIPPQLLGKAIHSIIRTARFPPTIAEIREEAEKIWSAAKGIDPPDAGKAWGDVQEAIRKYGGYRQPVFSDPLTAEIVQRIGWQEICMTPISDTVGLRAHFMKMYDAAAKIGKEKRNINRMLADGTVQKLVERVTNRLEAGKGGRLGNTNSEN